MTDAYSWLIELFRVYFLVVDHVAVNTFLIRQFAVAVMLVLLPLISTADCSTLVQNE